jgi:DNA-directed RNA polymerase subunit RPC12/RpoP
MIKTDPIRCTYCDSVQGWSAERTDSTMMGEVYVCPTCGEGTHTCDDHAIHEIEAGERMDWVAAEPIY